MRELKKKIMVSLKQKLKDRFTGKELDRLWNVMSLEYYPTQKMWAVSRTHPNNFFIQTQLGISSYKANKLIIRFLDTLDGHTDTEVNRAMMSLVTEHEIETSPEISVPGEKK